MKLTTRILEYFLITAVVWAYYASILPIYFYYTFNWNFQDLIKWWTTGTPIEFILAYPLAKVLNFSIPQIAKVLEKIEK